MSKTSLDVCTQALRMIGVAAVGQTISGEEYTDALAHMTDIFNTLNNTEGLAFDWTVETVPDGAFLPFARAVAGSVAGTYGAQQSAAAQAAMIDPRKSLYRVGMDGVREFAAPDMNHENHVVRAHYF